MTSTTTFSYQRQHLMSCHVAATSALTATYSNGTEGNGATLTNSGALAALVIDGVTLKLNDRVLVNAQSNGFENGIYFVTNPGSSSAAWVLQRAVDFQSVEQMKLGYFVTIEAGTANKGIIYVVTSVPATVGVDTITFTNATSDTDLGQAAFKDVSDNTKTTVPSLIVPSGYVNGEMAVYGDTNGTLASSGMAIQIIEANFGGGGASAVINNSIFVGATDHTIAQIKASTNAVTIQKVTPAAGQVTILMSADPGAGTVFTIYNAQTGI